MYKCAIVAVGGPRAQGIAKAYEQIKRGTLAAISTRQTDRLSAFGDTFQVQARYTDYREMFARERPDLVHVNTPPNVRLEVFEAAEAAGIPALIVEKPLAIEGEDFTAIRDFAARHPKIKIAINHQLHFHPRRLALQQFVREGKIGEVLYIEASAGMNLAYQGTHSLQAIGAFNPGAKPLTVFGQVAGTDGLRENDKQHYAPDQSLGVIAFDNGVRAVLQCGENAPKVGKGTINTHKRIAVYGTRGFIHWTMWSWETNTDGNRESGTHQYDTEDNLGQAMMTDAMFDWLEDPSAVHPLNLNIALQDFNIVLGLYTSAIDHRVVSLPIEPQTRLLASLRTHLASSAI